MAAAPPYLAKKWPRCLIISDQFEICPPNSLVFVPPVGKQVAANTSPNAVRVADKPVISANVKATIGAVTVWAEAEETVRTVNGFAFETCFSFGQYVGAPRAGLIQRAWTEAEAILIADAATRAMGTRGRGAVDDLALVEGNDRRSGRCRATFRR